MDDGMSTTSYTSGGDTNAKYSRLATEYSKVRAQLNVLKKAILEEKSNTVALKDAEKEKDVEMRKMQQEMESLQFRNVQLTKRVSMLQEQLDEAANMHKHHKKGKKKPDPMPSAVNSLPDVFGEELQNKLNENERLNKQLAAVQETFEVSSVELNEKLRFLTLENKGLQVQLDSINSAHQADIERLERQNEEIMQSLRKAQTEMSSLQLDLAKSRDECEKLKPFQPGFNNLSKRESTKPDLMVMPIESLFTPTLSSELNLLNVPNHFDSTETDAFTDVLVGMKTVVGSLTSSLGNFHSYCEQRSKLYPCDQSMEKITETCAKLGAITREKSQTLRKVESAIQQFAESEEKKWCYIVAIIKSLGDYVEFLKEILPLTSQSLEEECAVSWCTVRLEEDNRKYAGCFEALVTSFTDLMTTISPLIEYTEVPDVLVLMSFLNAVENCFQNLVKCLQECSDAYQAKVMSEHQLPTATKRLKTTNECILACLNTIPQGFAQLLKLIASNKVIWTEGMSSLLTSNPVTNEFRTKALVYMETLAKSSLPLSASLFSLRAEDVALVAEEVGLQDLIAQQSQKLSELEKEKEHWMLECQLLQMRTERTRSLTSDQTTAAAVDCPLLSRSNSKVDHNELSLAESYFAARVAELNNQCQLATSKLANYQKECANLLQTVRVYNVQKDKLQQELREASQTATVLRDDLETTRNGYESQMRMMTEHLANQNQKITELTDEVSMLREAMIDKVQRNSRNKHKH